MEIFPPQRHTLKDGRTVELRAVRPEDATEVVKAFGRMSEEARYMRFMRAVKEPDMKRLNKALASLPESGFSIIATVPAEDGFDIVGGTTYIIGQDPTRCEFAISVLQEFAGVGLAKLLLTSLIATARARGMEVMEGFVLAVNQPMLNLAKRLGFSNVPDPEGFDTRICRLDLRSQPD